MADFSRPISASLLRLRAKSPFFATLALFARFVPAPTVRTAGTDGKDIYFNPDYLRSLPAAQQDGLLLQAVLHAALLHVPRRGNRNPELWQAAADIAVNGAIAASGQFELPPDARRDPALEHFSVEEIYELLQQNPDEPPPNPSGASSDLLDAPPEPPGDAEDPPDSSPETNTAVPPPTGASLATYWRNAREQASLLVSLRGDDPAGLARKLDESAAAKLDWRRHLWRYLVQTPTDFSGFDRRFVGRGLYLDALQGESLQVFVAIDTSGSIDDRLLGTFLAEVRGILQAYPHIKGQLYYTDARAYGPYALADRKLATPTGGGGTSFVPFFECVEAAWERHSPGICVYLTDGYGSFPERAPELPVLWVVAPGGRLEFPFGEVTRLLVGAPREVARAI